MNCIFRWYKGLESVEHSFPVPGQTYLVCDGDFGVIEWKTKEALAVYDPESWGNLVDSAKSKKPSKEVRMTQEKHFVSISQLSNILNFRSKDVHVQPVHLRKVAGIIFSREHPRKVFVGYTHNMFKALQEVSVAKRGRASFRWNNDNLPRSHCERRPISAPKLAELKKKTVLSYQMGILSFIQVCQVQ
jgi:hypothetical protein